jgi:hypothetical protein
MADEIKATSKLAVVNGYFKETLDPGTITVTQSALGGFKAVQIIGTSAETVVTGDVATLGWAYFRNLDLTNYVDIGPDSTGIVGFLRLKAGETAGPFRLKPGITIKAQANTGNVKLQVFVLED